MKGRSILLCGLTLTLVLNCCVLILPVAAGVKRAK